MINQRFHSKLGTVIYRFYKILFLLLQQLANCFEMHDQIMTDKADIFHFNVTLLRTYC